MMYRKYKLRVNFRLNEIEREEMCTNKKRRRERSTLSEKNFTEDKNETNLLLFFVSRKLIFRCLEHAQTLDDVRNSAFVFRQPIAK